MRKIGIAVLAAAATAGGCGNDARPSGTIDVRVSAATSLQQAFTAIGAGYDGAVVRFSFAGSDQLAGQIRAGVRPDLFAAANAKLPRALFAEGLVERPVAFAHNRLVLAVPSDGAAVTGPDDLARRGVKLAIGGSDVPVGDYTRSVLAGLPDRIERAILANVRSEEPDVGGIVGKVAAGAVDAGFVYRTDVVAAGGRLRELPLPGGLDPDVVYEAAVVKGARAAGAARRFLAVLRTGRAAVALRRAGFLSAP